MLKSANPEHIIYHIFKNYLNIFFRIKIRSVECSVCKIEMSQAPIYLEDDKYKCGKCYQKAKELTCFTADIRAEDNNSNTEKNLFQFTASPPEVNNFDSSQNTKSIEYTNQVIQNNVCFSDADGSNFIFFCVTFSVLYSIFFVRKFFF